MLPGLLRETLDEQRVLFQTHQAVLVALLRSRSRRSRGSYQGSQEKIHP